MGTRSLIGRTVADETVTYIYCHWDGYISHNGAILAMHYQDSAKVDALLALGDLSSLHAEIGEQHDFDDRSHDDWCTAYGRDREERNTEAKTGMTEEAFWNSRREWGAEYLYLYKDGTWFVRAYDEEVMLLSDALATNAT